MPTRAERDTEGGATGGRPVGPERRQLINLAYRLLGSLADAEDVVQETYARWYAMTPSERDGIDAPAAWLSKVAGRICLDLLRSARVRRERYVGQWLPEPLPEGTDWARGQLTPTGTPVDPADRVTLDESISMAFLVILESMTPAERVAFILHDVFRYPFADIAEIVGRTPEACRQLASSARRRIRRADPERSAPARQVHIVKAFKQAWEAQDVAALVALLDPDCTVVADGGGKATAALDPIEGAEQIAGFFAGILNRPPTLTIVERTVNGQPGLVAQASGITETVLAFDITRDRITHIWAIRNPDKLHPWLSRA